MIPDLYPSVKVESDRAERGIKNARRAAEAQATALRPTASTMPGFGARAACCRQRCFVDTHCLF